MESPQLASRLSKISTLWSELRQAHQGPPEAAVVARDRLLQRYGGAIHRYLRAALRDGHGADDLAQEFALSLLRGEFRHADPQRGRFRDYVKGALFHLVSKYRRKEQKQPGPLPPGHVALATLAAAPEDANEFDATWRDELLERTWQALAREQPDFHAVLHFRAAHPCMPSAQMAEQLTPQLGRPLTAAGVRQTLHRARTRFVELLVEEVSQSLESPTPEQVEQELGELDLLAFCRPTLDQFRQGQGD
jgi:RNA polymerase sigma-70 factor (ECF subfamily)